MSLVQRSANMAALAEEIRFSPLENHQFHNNNQNGSPSQPSSPNLKNKLKFREKPNLSIEANWVLRLSIVMYRYAVMFVDFVNFVYQSIYEMFRLAFLIIFPIRGRSISGEVTIVTGAGQGIGRALALELAKEGAVVICVDKRSEPNEETALMVKDRRGLAYAFTCDVTSRHQIEELHRKVKKEVGDVSIVINNAGVLYCRPFLQHSAPQIENLIQTNLMGQMWMIREFLPSMMEKDKGSLVSMCSIAGHAGCPYMVPYSASKFAVKGMMEALHQELRAQSPENKIHLMTVSPFIVETDMIKGASIRFPNLINKVTAEFAAEVIVANLKKQSEIVFIPKRYYYLHNLVRLMPTRIQWLIFDFFDSGVDIHYDNTDNL